MKYVSISWSGRAEPDNAQIVQFLDLVRDNPQAKIFIHCQRGADRTGTMAAAYRVAIEHMKVDAAIDEMHHYHYATSCCRTCNATSIRCRNCCGATPIRRLRFARGSRTARGHGGIRGRKLNSRLAKASRCLSEFFTVPGARRIQRRAPVFSFRAIGRRR